MIAPDMTEEAWVMGGVVLFFGGKDWVGRSVS